MCILIPLVLISAILAVGIGPVYVPPSVTMQVIGDQLPLIGEMVEAEYTATQYNIIWGLRLPRVLLGMIVGAALAVCGVAMQALVRNKLADPFVLGISSGASAIATLVMIFGVFSFLGTMALPVGAFVGAVISTVLVYALSLVKGRINVPQLLLIGVAISMVMDAVTRIITISAPNALGLHNAEFWMSGSLAGAKWSYLGLPAVVMVGCLVFLMINYRSLNALLLGDETAAALGVNVGRMQKALVLVSSLLTGVTVAVSGVIGFVGLMTPHIARLLVGAEHRRVLPVSMLLGSLLVVWTDVAARMAIAPEELPVGLLTALLGAPFFVVLLKGRKGERI